jgi:hypothetical protein
VLSAPRREVDMNSPKYLRRKAAAEYVRQIWGAPCTPSWLAKLAVVGGGPKVANPNVHGLDKELTFRVQQTAIGEYGETLRTISLNGNAEVVLRSARCASSR